MGNYNLTTKAIQEQAERAAEGFPLLPKGKHLMRVKEATFKVVTNKETGKETDAIDLDLVVIAGEPCEHMQCRDTMFFSEKALGRVLLTFSALGVPDTELSNINPEDAGFRGRLVGRLAVVEVDHKKDASGRMWANPTYAGYKAAHPSTIEELKRSREAGAATPGGADDRSKIPF